MPHRILFVCLGNICRSPTAEAVVRQKAADRGIALELDSAGTGDWHLGKPPYGPMQDAALKRGYDLSPLRARQVMPQDFAAFDLIVAMDKDNRRDLMRLRGSAGAPVIVFTDYLNDPFVDHVPDPYFTRDFEGALGLIERAADGLLAQLEV